MKLKPPRCPFCEKPLEVVWETDYESYVFNPKLGTYELSENGELEVSCPNCNANLRDVFPDGVCNYLKRERR